MRFLLALALLALVPTLSAQTLNWEPLGGPYDDGVADLLALPTGDVFARSGHALFRSSDEGRTWEAVEVPTAVYDVEADGDALVVAGPGGVFRSDDLSASWSLLGLAGAGVTRVAVGPDGLALALAGEDVYRSTDGGASWEPVGGDVATGTPRGAVITPGGAMAVARLYYGDIPTSMVYRSTDGGQTWTASPAGFIVAGLSLGRVGEEVFAVASELSSFDFYIPPGLYRSGAGGASWTRLRQGATSGGGRLADGRFWTGTPSGLLVSDDGGETWTATAIETAASPSALLFDDGALLAGSGTYCDGGWDPPFVCYTSGGLFRLDPADEAPQQVGLREGAASALAWGPDGDLLAATSSNLLRWTGTAWEPLRWRGGPLEDVVALDGGLLVASRDVYGLVRLSDGTQVLDVEGCFEFDCGVFALARDADGALFASAAALLYGDTAGLFRSTDGGTTWGTVLPEINNVEVLAVGSGGEVFAGTGGEPWHTGEPGSGVYRSTDGGDAWEQLDEGLGDGVTALAVGPSGEAFAAVEGGGVRRLGSGDVWEPFGLDGRTVAALVVTEREQEVAGTDAGVFVHDGVGWVSAGLPLVTSALLLGPGGVGYAATEEGVFRTVGPLVVGTEESAATPTAAALEVYPNPTAGAGTVALTVATPGPVTVAVYDVLGRRVGLVHDGPLGRGTHRLRFDAGGLPAGTYVVRADGLGLARRVTVLR